MTVLTILIGTFACLVALPVGILFAEVLFAGAPDDDREKLETGPRPTLAVVIPAHNEASGIAETLRSVRPQLAASDCLLVVADNCSDNTAAVALAEGARVIVRTDTERRGKSYALDFAVSSLRSSPPEVVIIIDADCNIADGSIDHLTRLCGRTSRPVQSLYLMHAPKGARLKMRVAEFAWTVRNHVRPAGLHRFGLPCPLMGTGMAFPWVCLSEASLTSNHLVEDRKLGIDLARAGAPPLFCARTLVTSTFPVADAGVQSQRTRWEHGSLAIAVREAPSAFLDSLVHLNPGLMALALDLCVPPLALLTLLVAVVWVASAVSYFLSGVQFPFCVASSALALLMLSVMLSWARFGRQTVSLSELATAGLYALWKVPLYAKFLVARQLEWVRSTRDDEDKRPGP